MVVGNGIHQSASVNDKRHIPSFTSKTNELIAHLEKNSEILEDILSKVSIETQQKVIKKLISRRQHEYKGKKDSCEVENLFNNVVDSNKDGFVTMEEFKSWFEKYQKAEEKEEDVSKFKPTFSQTWAVAFRFALPCIGFGFLDNSIMLLAGGTIEDTFGVYLGLTTLGAAALGNLVSDICGIGFSGTIDAAAGKLGLPDPKLTRAQEQAPRIRWIRILASMIGITLGGILGMFPLLFNKQHDHHLLAVFRAIDTDNSGQVEIKELKNVFKTLGISVDEAELNELFEFVDKDKNGAIDFEEFCVLVEGFIARSKKKKQAVKQ